jgi:hypothetical protein
MKKLLMLFAAVALLAACGKEGGDEMPSGELAYKGTMEVEFRGETVPTENVVVTVDYDKEKKTMDLLFHQVKFVPQMPVTLDILVPGIPVLILGGKISFSGEGIVPTTGGLPYEQYTVTGLAGALDEKGITFSLNFGSFPTSYSGTRVK